MQRPEIPFTFLTTQTCRNCQMPISCEPVYVVNDLTLLCGRCKILAKDHYRNVAYEALASVFLYPCKNWRNHCPMKLRWNDSLKHEKECNYSGCCTFFLSHPGAFFKGKRDFPRDEIRLVLIPENLLAYIKCVFCEGYLSCAPVYLQSNGQNVCHRCANANGNPPNCRRNYAYENFSKMFVFPCRYRNKGCTEKTPFGMQVWQHEAECDYGPNYKQKISPAPQHNGPGENKRTSSKLKEKGLVKTQTGVIWATITPNSDAAKHLLVKSLAKKQARHIRRADDIGNEMGGRNSDSESISTTDENSVSYSGHSTPDPLEPYRRPAPYMPPEDYNGRPAPNGSRPGSRESGYQTAPFQEDLDSNSGSIRNSLRPKESFRDTPVAGNFPVLVPHKLNDGFDSIGKRYSQRESFHGNTMLINELKIKQDIIKRTHSIKGEQDMKNPYKTCNNLEDIKEVHRQIS